MIFGREPLNGIQTPPTGCSPSETREYVSVLGQVVGKRQAINDAVRGGVKAAQQYIPATFLEKGGHVVDARTNGSFCLD